MTKDTHAGLLERFIRSKDADAFALITRQYAGMVYGTCVRITGNAERAADATQETFFHLAKHARKVSGSLAGWLHHVAVGKSVNLVRSDVARRRREEEYAAQPRATDLWSEISPLVDEAMGEVEPEHRDLLLRHFLQGATTVSMAAADGVSQPTMSRRIEGALEELRDRLRKKGVGVAASVLGTMMAGTAWEAPAAVLTELGKMALATSGTVAASTATATALGLNAKLAVAAVVAVVGVGGFVAYNTTRPAKVASPTLAAAQPAEPPAATGEPGAPLADSQTAVALTPPPVTPLGTSRPATGPGLMGGVAQPQGFGGGAMPSGGVPVGGMAIAGGMAMGGMGYGGYSSEPAPTRATSEGALTLFANALVRGDPARWLDCFDGTVETNPVRRALENPTTDAEREWQQILKSLRPPVELVGTTATEDGLKVKWKATVLQPFTTTENGVSRTWQRGDRFELEVRLMQLGGEWKIVGF